MPEIRISKIKVRRGTDSQRRRVIFDQGELVYTTNTKRLFVGSGTLSGGDVVGSKTHPIVSSVNSLSTQVAEVGDLINANNTFYQLTASDFTNMNCWANVGTKLGSSFIKYDAFNLLTVDTDSISASHLKTSTISNGLSVIGGVLQSNFNTKSLEISANKLSLKVAGIDEREISSSSLTSGLIGGSGDKIRLDTDPLYFVYNGNTLSLSATPKQQVRFSDLSASWFGVGLTYNAAQSTIALSSIGVSSTNQWPRTTVDAFGRVISQTSSIFGALTGNSALASHNSSSPLSAIFNGTPSHSLSGGVPGINLVRFTALSSDGSTVTLSSAGFLTFEGPTTTRTGQLVGRFAIPIFAY